MYFTSFENANLTRLGLRHHRELGTFFHTGLELTVTCIPTGYVDDKVTTRFEISVADHVYNFELFSHLLITLQTLLREAQA